MTGIQNLWLIAGVSLAARTTAFKTKELVNRAVSLCIKAGAFGGVGEGFVYVIQGRRLGGGRDGGGQGTPGGVRAGGGPGSARPGGGDLEGGLAEMGDEDAVRVTGR